jgi:2'-5' RNA ligase
VPGRCFLAVDLPHPSVLLLRDAQTAIARAAPEWGTEKWVRPELLHVTVKFIGPLPDATVDEALAALAAVCAPLCQPALELAYAHAVPSARRASMVWATLKDTAGTCETAAATVDAELARGFGVAPDVRAFRPHITLVRARSPRSVPSDAIAAADACLAAGREMDRIVSVPSFTLYSSTLGPHGPAYALLGRVPVGG